MKESKTLDYYENKISEGFSRDKYSNRAIVEYCNTYEEMGDLFLEKGDSEYLWKAYRFYGKAIEGPEDSDIASKWDYDWDQGCYHVDYDSFEKPDLARVKTKLAKLASALEEVYKKEAWIQKPDWIAPGDFYHIVYAARKNPLVKEVLNYILEEYKKPCYENSALIKPSWLKAEKYKALLDYSLLNHIDKKNEKLCLLFKIYRNLHLADYIYSSNIMDILDLECEDPLLDNRYSLTEEELIKDILNDFQEIYLNMAKAILKEKGESLGSPLSLFDVPALFHDCGEPYLEPLYSRIIFDEAATRIELIDKYIGYYCAVRKKCRMWQTPHQGKN
jgi:hypothetical protein